MKNIKETPYKPLQVVTEEIIALFFGRAVKLAQYQTNNKITENCKRKLSKVS